MNLRYEIEQLTPALRRLCHALIGSEPGARAESADDLVHETLLRALRFEPPVKGMPIRHWLYAILIGRYRHHARASGFDALKQDGGTRHLRQNEQFEARSRAHRAGDAHPRQYNAVTGKSDADDIVARLHALPPEEREALLLVALEGLSYSDAADVLGLPRPTLVARLARARATFAQTSHKRQMRAAPEITHLRLVK